MLSSTAYISSGVMGGGVGAGYHSDAASSPASTPVSSSSPAGDNAQGTNTSLTGADTVALSSAALQLALQNGKDSATPSSTDGRELRQTQELEQAQNPLGKTNNAASSETEEAEDKAAPGETNSSQPNPQEQQKIQALKLRDQEVRTHEAAHAAVGGQYAGAPKLEYETGPDGKRYAVSGEVSIDLSKVKGSPQETIAKMEQIQAAALAPAQPSSQDRRVAARAAQIATQARMELRTEQDSVRSAESSTTQNSTTSAIDSSNENGEPQQSAPASSYSTPAVTIESLRWEGAVA